MNAPEGPAAPKDGTSEIPTFEQLAADPEIAALLDFEPVPRRFEREDGWTPALQRRFIAYLAWTGSPGKACDALGKRRSGIDKLAKLEGAASFRAAWARAVEIAQERKAARVAAAHAPTADLKLPFVDHRRKHAQPQQQGPLPGQVMNENGEWEDEESYRRRAELLAEINDWRREQGLDAVDWDESTERGDPALPSPPSGGEGRERGAA